MVDYIDSRLLFDDVLKFNNSFKKEDYHRIPPVNGIDNVNRPGDIIFTCANKQTLLGLFDSLLFIKLRLTSTGDTMTLEHNAILRMFDSMKLMFGSNEIESLSSAVGEATTMINSIVTGEAFRRTNGYISGWFVDTDADPVKNKGYKARV